ncbi:sigma 54-interacting transcriptional regulator [Brevibacillus centrosporus]|uniref:sigma-54 interaction domain-containing protein n=1 Tax=Brevibacillus centrosporus TaxID=54910 RepID=UPI002E1B372A|nr:sigma 54-interacting transcriptional regulator [Brevibacillus centrosporus]MED4907099.1 sigma 54-interacting transcriptional regulator [Brevibacillus centrosporus]
MHPLRPSMTVEEAVAHFSPGSAEVQEVYNEEDEFVGYLTVESISLAMQRGELTRPILEFVVPEVSLQDQEQQTSSRSQLHAFFQSPISGIIFNSLYDGVYITDDVGITLFINQAYQRITGISEEEVKGVHMEALIKQGIISVSASLETIRTKRPVTLIQTIRNGRKIIVSATPVLAPNKEILYVISSVRDITELIRLKHELDSQKLRRQSLKEDALERPAPGQGNIVVGPATRSLFQLAEKVAKTDAKVLLQGETGVGKSMIAKYIHSRSARSKETFMELNCAAIPGHLVEAELFGYEPGSFTGALKSGKVGILESAHRGTLFLDEIGDLPLELQVKLLKVVEESQFMRVGSTEVRHVDVRIITATHRDLATLVREGLFREDLYYRLNIVTFEVPPLRNRKEEIVPLLETYLGKFNEKYQENKTMTLECYEWLTNYQWPGNIRELANLVERLVVTTYHDSIDVGDLPSFLQQVFPASEPASLKEAVARLERTMITNAIQAHGTTRAAAEALGISQSAIVQKMKKLHLRVENESS